MIGLMSAAIICVSHFNAELMVIRETLKLPFQAVITYLEIRATMDNTRQRPLIGLILVA